MRHLFGGGRHPALQSLFSLLNFHLLLILIINELHRSAIESIQRQRLDRRERNRNHPDQLFHGHQDQIEQLEQLEQHLLQSAKKTTSIPTFEQSLQNPQISAHISAADIHHIQQRQRRGRQVRQMDRRAAFQQLSNIPIAQLDREHIHQLSGGRQQQQQQQQDVDDAPAGTQTRVEPHVFDQNGHCHAQTDDRQPENGLFDEQIRSHRPQNARRRSFQLCLAQSQTAHIAAEDVLLDGQFAESFLRRLLPDCKKPERMFPAE